MNFALQKYQEIGLVATTNLENVERMKGIAILIFIAKLVSSVARIIARQSNPRLVDSRKSQKVLTAAINPIYINQVKLSFKTQLTLGKFSLEPAFGEISLLIGVICVI